MKNIFFFLVAPFFLGMSTPTLEFPVQEESVGLRGVIVEEYYVAGNADGTIENRSITPVPKGAVTYRIYADLAPDHVLYAVYGDKSHPLEFKTTTSFFNTPFGGKTKGEELSMLDLVQHTSALDSWITMNTVTDEYLGILKEEDTSGSVLVVDSTFHAVSGKSESLLRNEQSAETSLVEKDGLLAGKAPSIVVFGMDMSIFDHKSENTELVCNNCAWSVLGGAIGPTESNRVLIAQLTTDGDFSFKLNLQTGLPADGLIEYHVADSPKWNESTLKELTYSSLISKSE